jgi:hypothetical protein
MKTSEAAEGIKVYRRFRTNPYGFVLFAYPWGKHRTFLAPDRNGVIPTPEKWQVDVLKTLGAELTKRDMSPDEVFAAICIAVASGHGIGKTTLVAWLIDWFICCFPNPQIIVTAGTASQLEKKTWRELSKWHKVSMHKNYFEWTATKYYLKEDPDTWFAAAMTWSEHRADAFAGTHEKYVLVIFDEASAIADIIWETVEGAMTTAMCVWIAFGNPIRNTGRFKACFGKFKKYWITRKVDSRSARIANKVQIAQWAEQYGEDSDFFRKRVRGEFPLHSTNQLITETTVDMCRSMVAYGYESFPIRIGCDVAGEGEEGDDTYICVMQGNKMHELFRLKGKDTVQIYTKLIETYNHWKMKNDRIAIFIDAIGIGAGVYNMTRRALVGIPVFGVISGATANNEVQFFNVRIEMWYNMAGALKEGVDMTAIGQTDFDRLKDDLINIEYFEHPQNQKYQLEAVKDMKERDLLSPDAGTSVALTFAYPVPHVVQSSTERFAKANGGAGTITKKKGLGHGVRKNSRGR